VLGYIIHQNGSSGVNNMKKDDKIKGGKADKLSIEDISKKHDVSVESIKSQIEMGKKIEMEHVDDVELAEEISMDHLDEIPDYYTRLKEMEKEAKKELSLEAKKFMALAGIKEDDKKFLKNESFSQENTIIKESMGDITPEEWAEMHPEKTKSDDDFIVLKFEQEEVESGKDDDELYKLKQ